MSKAHNMQDDPKGHIRRTAFKYAEQGSTTELAELIESHNWLLTAKSQLISQSTERTAPY
jgi:hypothetical protein